VSMPPPPPPTHLTPFPRVQAPEGAVESLLSQLEALQSAHDRLAAQLAQERAAAGEKQVGSCLRSPWGTRPGTCGQGARHLPSNTCPFLNAPSAPF
jgi:hypothetical protein